MTHASCLVLGILFSIKNRAQNLKSRRKDEGKEHEVFE